jgi:hypothetical protein
MAGTPSGTPGTVGSSPERGASVIFLTPVEFHWLTLGVLVGGIFILTLLPYLLVPRVGGPLGIASSYFVFFVTWQPIQLITQRTFGMKVAVIRMIVFVAGAATVAAFLRQALPSLTGAG